MKTFLVFCTASLIAVAAGDGLNLGGLNNASGALYDLTAVNCDLAFDSPQFAVLCRLPDVNLQLSLVANLGLGLGPLASELLNYTANQICDGDCRCVMGAAARGGSCGTPSGKTQKYCVCDYGVAPVTPQVEFECTVFEKFVTPLCTPDVLTNGFLEGACDADCQCSHGYGNTGNHKCSNVTGTFGCVCDNAITLPLA